MTTSELVTPQHLSPSGSQSPTEGNPPAALSHRKAIIYIRQSSPDQIVSNQESLRLQYALRQRGVELGWHADKVEVIDSDLGTTGATAVHREGFKELLAQVTLSSGRDDPVL